MVAVGISEFGFGFAFLIEQVNKYKDNLRHCPFLPNLREEAELGYDAYLPIRGIDFYYQFKIPYYLSRGNARYRRNGEHAGPYFRFWLEKNQHNRLFRLSQSKPYTYYVAPRINHRHLFDEAFLTRTLAARTILIPVPDCPNIQNDETHCITFPAFAPGWKWHSNHKSLDSEISGKDFGNLIEKSKKDWKPINDKFANELIEGLFSLVEQTYEMNKFLAKIGFKNIFEDYHRKKQQGHVSKLLIASKISLGLFGANLVLVGEKES